MEKRYQVFVSSTYADLQEERQEVMQALLELDCIPAGMELFPAANEDQWTLIKKVIDDCDYYMVIIAGRYGSIGPERLSFTEMEYRYAVDSGKPVLGFVHRSPDLLAAGRCEDTDEGKEKLGSFRGLVQKKMCRFWESPADLGSQVSRSLVKLIKASPGIGWVRGDMLPNGSTAEEILGLRRQVEELQAEIKAAISAGPEGASELAQGEDCYDITFTFFASTSSHRYDGESYSSKIKIDWNRIFSAVSPLMIHEAKDEDVRRELNSLVRECAIGDLEKSDDLEGLNLIEFKINPDDFHTIKVQLRALGLITKSTKSRSLRDTSTYWTLTPYGDNVMTKLRAIRKPKPKVKKPIE